MRDRARSRRGIFVPHADDRVRLARCPVCRWAVEQDHEEALAIHAASTRAGNHRPAPTPSGSTERKGEETIARVDFALV